MVFCFVQNFFFGQSIQELEYLFFLLRKARNFFPQFNVRLYDKNSESDYFFFPPPKSEYFFQQHWESEYLKVKWSFPKDKIWVKVKISIVLGNLICWFTITLQVLFCCIMANIPHCQSVYIMMYRLAGLYQIYSPLRITNSWVSFNS